MKRSKIKLIVLQLGLLVAVLGSFVVAVIVPWLLARNAGLVAVNGALETLIRGETSHMLSDVGALFKPTIGQIGELLEELYSVNAIVNASDSAAVLHRLVLSGLRYFPSWNLRYACIALTTGRMECAAFSAQKRLAQLQQVVVLDDNGTLSTQRQWDCDSVSRWNSSWPANFDDIGNYNPLDWAYESEPHEGPWWVGTYLEETSEGVFELFVSTGAAVRDPVSGAYLGALSIDILLDQVSVYLRKLTISNNTRIAVINIDGIVIGSSLNLAPYTIDSEGNPREININNVNDSLLASVANALRSEHDWFFANEQLYSHYKVVDINDGKLSDDLSVYIFPLSDPAIGLNLTIIVVVPESDFTSTLLRGSQIAFVVGICILIGVPLLIGIVVFAISRAIIKTSIKVVNDENADGVQLATGLDNALKTLHRLRSGDIDSSDAPRAIEGLIKMLSSSNAREALFQPDINAAAKQGRLDRDQEQWLRSEVLGTQHPAQVSWEGLRTFSVVNLSAVNIANVSKQIALLSNGVVLKWDCDVNELDKVNVLVSVAAELLHLHQLMEMFELDMIKVTGFLKELQATYRENPYHDVVHAADVTQAIGWLMSNVPELPFTPLEKLAMLIAATMHDAGHPGRNNQFLITTGAELATLYNDASPLENHHLYVGFTLLHKYHMLDGMPDEQRREFRKMVISLVLATDMAFHFQVLSEFTAARQHGDLPSKSNELQGSEEQRRRVMKVLIKLADISNAARPQPIMRKWADRVFEEFMQQGDEEKQLGLAVSPHMDRSVAQLPRIQANFYKFIAVPLFSAFNEYRPLPEIMAHVQDNYAFWRANDRRESMLGTGKTTELITPSIQPDAVSALPL